MSAVQAWIAGVLQPDEDEAQQVRVTVRLDAGDYVDLKEVAAHLGLSATGAASGLLRSAISEAQNTLRLYALSDEQRRENAEEQEGVPV